MNKFKKVTTMPPGILKGERKPNASKKNCQFHESPERNHHKTKIYK